MVYFKADGNYSSVVTVDGVERLLSLQLGQIEKRIEPIIEKPFARVGRGLLVNCDFISYLDVSRQKLILSDYRTFTREFSASKEALKQLKKIVEEIVEQMRSLEEGVEQKASQ